MREVPAEDNALEALAPDFIDERQREPVLRERQVRASDVLRQVPGQAQHLALRTAKERRCHEVNDAHTPRLLPRGRLADAALPGPFKAFRKNGPVVGVQHDAAPMFGHGLHVRWGA